MEAVVSEHVMSHHEQLEAASSERVMFGFWLYLMTDLLMFAVLFACYSVLHGNNVGSPAANALYSLPAALHETLILLTSSFTCGIAMVYARRGNKNMTLLLFGITFILGLLFLKLELSEFSALVHDGYSLQTNAFLSSFFVLVGTHGLHITAGLLWMAITLIFVMKRGLNAPLLRKLSLLSLFWHFLDIVWIFIFTIVYLGAYI